MEPFGAGAPEIRLYRRPSYCAPLVELAALGPVAPPRVLEVVSDPTGEEVDGEPSRRPGLYLALVQGGAVVDVARLASYAGQAAGPEDLEEDYLLNGSDSSEDWRTRSRSSSSGKSNSEERKSGSAKSNSEERKSGSEKSNSEERKSGSGGRSSEEHNDKSTRSRSRSSRSETSSREEQSGNSSQTSSREEQSGNSSRETSSREEQRGNSSSANTSSADHDAESSRGISGTSQDKTSGDEMKVDQQERSDHDLSSRGDLTSSTEESNGDDVDAVYGDEGWTVNAMDASSSDETQGNNSSNDDEEDVSADDDEDVGDDDKKDDADDEFILCPKEACAKILEVEGKEEEKDVSSEEEKDVSSEEEKDVSSEEEQCRSVKLKLRIWPWQKHTSIKIFCGQKWIASKVYRLTWINHEELEELFESSFKLDICAPISANTVFRIRHCIMDFEAFMLDSPCFNELIDEFKSSVRDFRFCKKTVERESVESSSVCRRVLYLL